MPFTARTTKPGREKAKEEEGKERREGRARIRKEALNRTTKSERHGVGKDNGGGSKMSTAVGKKITKGEERGREGGYDKDEENNTRILTYPFSFVLLLRGRSTNGFKNKQKRKHLSHHAITTTHANTHISIHIYIYIYYTHTHRRKNEGFSHAPLTTIGFFFFFDGFRRHSIRNKKKAERKLQ